MISNINNLASDATERFAFGNIYFRRATVEEKAATRLKSCRGAAIALALKHGWHVFPVPPGTKKSYKAAKYSDGNP